MTKNNKTILAVSVISILTCGIIGLIPTNSSPNNEAIIISKPTENTGLVLNASEIKMRNVGDTFILQATVNDDATFKSVSFYSSDEEAISVSKLSDNSCKLTKLKDFTEYVEISVISDDPFVDLSSTCLVRAYNNLAYLFGDIYWHAYKDEVYFEIENQYKILLVEGATYEFKWEVGTTFGSLDENKFPLTFKDVEDEDMAQLKQNVQNLFGENKLNFFNTFIENSKNYIEFGFTYEYLLFDDEIEKNIYFPYYDMDVSWFIEKYVAATNVNINNEDILVI